MRKRVLRDTDGKLAFVEEAEHSHIAIPGYEPVDGLELSDADWTKWRRKMKTHDISLEPGNNTIKATKRKEVTS